MTRETVAGRSPARRLVTRRRAVTLAGLAAGVTAAGTAAVIAAERLAAARIRLSPDPAAAERLGGLRGREISVRSADGLALHAEANGPDDAPVTIIFSHGYALNQDSWHYQRRDLADAARCVFWDQRGHGRSDRLAGQLVTLDQTAEDLYAVIRAVAPGRTRVVLAGHSMGGMTIMALAGLHPELFGTTVAGVALISTAAGGLSSPAGLAPWLRGPLRKAIYFAAPAVLRAASQGRRAVLAERGRRLSRNLEFAATSLLAFGDGQVSPALAGFLDRMIRDVPLGVIAEYYGALVAHDKQDVLGVLAAVPVTVITGEQDRLLPPQLSADLAAAIPGARLVIVPGAGHAVILERPDAVNDAIRQLVTQAVPGRRARRAGRGRGEGRDR